MKYQALDKKLVSNARAIIANEIAIPLGCVRMNKILSWLGDGYKHKYPVFSEFLIAAMGLPLTSERLQWSREALMHKDEEIFEIIGHFRSRILMTCFDILESECSNNDDH